MCLFFKKKPKFKADDADAIIAYSVAKWDFVGFPAKEDRNDENFKISQKPFVTGTRCFALNSTVNGVKFELCLTFDMTNSTLGQGFGIHNVSINDNASRRQLIEDYPGYKFEFNSGWISIHQITFKDGKMVEVEKICKTLTELDNGVKDIYESFAYTHIYEKVIELSNKEKAGK